MKTSYVVYGDSNYSDDNVLFETPDREILGRILSLRREALDRVDNPDGDTGTSLHGNGRLYLGIFSIVYVKKVVR